MLCLDPKSYSDLVENAPKGSIALVLLTDSEDSLYALHLKQLFVTAVSKHRWGNVTLCSLSVGTYPTWFKEFANRCLHLDTAHVESFKNTYQRGKTAIVLTCFGAKRQFCVFPDDLVSAAPRQTVCEVLEGSLGLEDDHGSDGVSESQESSSEVSPDGTVGKGQTETKVFLGFDVWLERLADGTLKRHSVELWPLLR